MPRIESKGAFRRKSDIVAALIRGVMPVDLPGASPMGEGSLRKAYAVGNYVVKRDDGNHHLRTYARKRLRDFGLKLKAVPTTYVETRTGRYVVQPRCLRAEDIDGMDIHLGNIGFDKRGTPVLYDW